MTNRAPSLGLGKPAPKPKGKSRAALTDALEIALGKRPTDDQVEAFRLAHRLAAHDDEAED